MRIRVAGSLLLVSLVAACDSSPDPGDTLAGHWKNADARLDATASGVVFAARCEQAEFGPLMLDANGKFQAESVVFEETGNINHSPDDRLRISGFLVGNELHLQLYFLRVPLSVGDPIAMTLSTGTSHDPLVCNA